MLGGEGDPSAPPSTLKNESIGNDPIRMATGLDCYNRDGSLRCNRVYNPHGRRHGIDRGCRIPTDNRLGRFDTDSSVGSQTRVVAHDPLHRDCCHRDSRSVGRRRKCPSGHRCVPLTKCPGYRFGRGSRNCGPEAEASRSCYPPSSTIPTLHR